MEGGKAKRNVTLYSWWVGGGGGLGQRFVVIITNYFKHKFLHTFVLNAQHSKFKQT